MAPPLEVPVDLNPIVKEPPLFTDGPLRPISPFNSPIDISFTNVFGTTAIYYDAGNDEIFVTDGTFNDPVEVAVLDGYSNTVKRSFNMTITGGSERVNDIALDSNKNIVCYIAENKQIQVFDSTGGAQVSAFPINAPDMDNPTQSGGIIIDDGDAILYQRDTNTGTTKAYRLDGISGTVKQETDFGTDYQDINGATVVDGKLVIGQSTGGSTGFRLFNGIESSTVLVQSGLTDADAFWGGGASAPRSIAYAQGIGFIFSGEDGSGNVIRLGKTIAGDAGLSFIGNSSKTLATGKVYSFRIQGPNQTTTPTINDGGQGAVTITLPSGLDVPNQSLTGNLDFYYDGNNYIVQSLTTGLAEAIYDGLARVPGSSTDQSALGFGTWRTPDNDRPIAVFCDLHVETDGVANGEARLEIDESGGTTADFDKRALIDLNGGAGAHADESMFQIIEPGASYQINNASDPNDGNAIRMLRELPL